MSNFIELKCTNCGGELTQNPQDSTYSCKMCNAKYMLKFEHGGIQVERILDSKLQGVEAGVSVVASEMAIQRLREDIRTQAQEISQSEARLKEQENYLRSIPNTLISYQTELEQLKLPKERKYRISWYIAFFLIAFPFTCLWMLGVSLPSNSPRSGGNSLEVMTLFLIGILLLIGWQFFSVLRARSKYMKQNRQRLSDEIQTLRNTGISIKRSYQETKSQLQMSKNEVSEKQRELKWHSKNVKLKRD